MKHFLPIVILFLFANCKDDRNEEERTIANHEQTEELEVVDAHSYANPSEVRTQHLHLNIAIDFEKQIIKGKVEHSIEHLNESRNFIVDIHDLKIDSVFLDDSIKVDWEIGDFDSIMGQAMHIPVLPETKIVTIHYETSPNSKALQWLNPQQTAGKKFPYLFTQGQAILTRTWIPCQDTPGNRISYSADLKVPPHLMAVMSATNVTSKHKAGNYHFEMDKRIPTYLIALAVGDIHFQGLSDRTGVYAEREMLSASAYEFEQVEEMILAAEELYGAYRWGRYDMIVLPPSFPYGGMENPKLTFATPTIIAGNRSLVSLIAHELAHSWSGNLVTNATWDDFWLNEGFTVYFENRIMEKIYGIDYANMLFSIEYDDLIKENEEILNGEHPEDSKLKLDLAGRDPDDGMTAIAYVKGALFLKTIEAAVGREKFDVFVDQYFNEHAFQTITTEDFIIYLEEELLVPNEVNFNVDEWVYEKGIPNNAIKIESSRFDEVELKSSKIKGMKSVEELGIEPEKFTTHEWIHFIRNIPETATPEEFAMLDSIYNFTNCGNAEIMAVWYVKSIEHNYTYINESMRLFLTEVGRRKFLEPIYEELVKSEEGLVLARDIYSSARANYHSISVGTIDEILNWQK